MPGLDGRKTVEQIRKMDLKTRPFICATSSLISEGSLANYETERTLCFEVNNKGKFWSVMSQPIFLFQRPVLICV